MLPEPTITDFLEHARQGTVGEDELVDFNRGSDYEAISGASAMLWSRQVQRDTDLFKATRFNDAEAGDLTFLVESRYGVPRLRDTRGAGTATFRRSSTAGGAGTVWKGTRFRVSAPLQSPVFYRVTQDTAVGASDLVAYVPVEALELGPGSKFSGAPSEAALIDALWDASWAVSSLECADGVAMEQATAYRARTRAARQALRPGYPEAIEAACKAAGAANVALFRGDYAGPSADLGLNYVYVGDLSYSGTPSLVRACTFALRSARVAGDNCQVLPLARVDLNVAVTIYLRAAPELMPLARLEPIHRQAILQYFTDVGRFTYTVSGIETAIARTGNETQDIVLTSPSADATILTNGAFPAQLSRYFVTNNGITIRYLGPS